MRPVTTTDSNDLLRYPRPKTAVDKVDPLPIHREPHCITSHWQLTNEDVEALRENGGIISFTILSAVHPPIMLACDRELRRAEPREPDNPKPVEKNGSPA